MKDYEVQQYQAPYGESERMTEIGRIFIAGEEFFTEQEKMSMPKGKALMAFGIAVRKDFINQMVDSTDLYDQLIASFRDSVKMHVDQARAEREAVEKGHTQA